MLAKWATYWSRFESMTWIQRGYGLIKAVREGDWAEVELMIEDFKRFPTFCSVLENQDISEYYAAAEEEDEAVSGAS